jgi:nicotinamidase-related amidase
MVPKVKQLISACRAAKIPVIFTQEVHRSTRIDMGRELDRDEPDHCLLGTRGVEIHTELTPGPDDYHIRKARYDAFLGTDLEFVLNGLHVLPHDTLIVCGVATNVCVHYTCAAADQRDYRVKVVEDCCAGRSVAEHDAALTQVNYLQNGSRVTLEEILKDIGTHTARKPTA